MTDRILLPKCDKRSCDRIPQVYVDITGEDLCEEHGGKWSEDEKIPVQLRTQGAEKDIQSVVAALDATPNDDLRELIEKWENGLEADHRILIQELKELVEDG